MSFHEDPDSYDLYILSCDPPSASSSRHLSLSAPHRASAPAASSTRTATAPHRAQLPRGILTGPGQAYTDPTVTPQPQGTLAVSPQASRFPLRDDSCAFPASLLWVCSAWYPGSWVMLPGRPCSLASPGWALKTHLRFLSQWAAPGGRGPVPGDGKQRALPSSGLLGGRFQILKGLL